MGKYNNKTKQKQNWKTGMEIYEKKKEIYLVTMKVWEVDYSY